MVTIGVNLHKRVSQIAVPKARGEVVQHPSTTTQRR